MSVPISRDEVAGWSRYVQEISGIALDESKGYLLETRLGRLLDENNAATFSDLLRKARSDATNSLRRQVLESITTNETSFFRDNAPFELLKHKLIPELLDRRAKNPRTPIRIWSAACSTGQEAYSVAILFKELLGELSRYDIRILGTDISNRAVAQASYAEYTPLELERGMPADKVARHFTPAGQKWKLRDELRALASFRTMNLLDPISLPVPFDIIFCRNVAIYFNEADKQRLFRTLLKTMAAESCLLVGSTESIVGFCPDVTPKRYHHSVYYQLK